MMTGPEAIPVAPRKVQNRKPMEKIMRFSKLGTVHIAILLLIGCLAAGCGAAGILPTPTPPTIVEPPPPGATLPTPTPPTIVEPPPPLTPGETPGGTPPSQSPGQAVV